MIEETISGAASFNTLILISSSPVAFVLGMCFNCCRTKSVVIGGIAKYRFLSPILLSIKFDILLTDFVSRRVCHTGIYSLEMLAK